MLKHTETEEIIHVKRYVLSQIARDLENKSGKK